MMDGDCDQEIDVTDKVCPLTFVHARLTIDAMMPGKVLAICLRNGEATENVPKSIKELGHKVLSLKPINEAADIYRLRILIT